MLGNKVHISLGWVPGLEAGTSGWKELCLEARVGLQLLLEETKKGNLQIVASGYAFQKVEDLEKCTSTVSALKSAIIPDSVAGIS